MKNFPSKLTFAYAVLNKIILQSLAYGVLSVHRRTNYRIKCVLNLNFKRRIKSHLPFAGIIMSSPYSPRFWDKG
jgi:hypothetical protein